MMEVVVVMQSEAGSMDGGGQLLGTAQQETRAAKKHRVRRRKWGEDVKPQRPAVVVYHAIEVLIVQSNKSNVWKTKEFG